MTNKLKQYFPMLHTREFIMEKIEADRHLKVMFEEWDERYQKEFLDFCTGVRGRTESVGVPSVSRYLSSLL